MKLLLVAILISLVNIQKVASQQQQFFLQEPCKAWRVLKQYQDGTDNENSCYCELQGRDLEDRGKHYQMLPLADMPSHVCQDIIASGTTEILPNQLRIRIENDNEDSETSIRSKSSIRLKLMMEAGNSIANQHWNISGWNDLMNQNQQIMKYTQLDKSNHGRRLATTGTRSLLVIRGIGADTELTKTARQLADDIFGTEGDPVNLKSQFDACSYGALTFEPARIGDNQNNEAGVHDVAIPYDIEGIDEEFLENEFLDQATKNLGVESLSSLADNVIVCIPPGTVSRTRKKFVAYAYLDGYVSVFNDKLCSSPTVVMHEVGHNLGLSHSNEDEGGGKIHYRDQSGLMGFGYSGDDTPKLCFNGVKTYQLGWFSEYHHDLLYPNIRWDGTMVGFVNKEDVSTDHPMILRLINTSGGDVAKDYYIHFNRRDSFNSGTQDGADKVLVASRSSGTDTYSNSLLEAKLDVGEHHVIAMNGDNDDVVTIYVESIRDNANGLREAHVVITSSLSTMRPSLAPSPSPSDATVPPSPSPTLSATGCNDANSRQRRSIRRYLRWDSRNNNDDGCVESEETTNGSFGGNLPSFQFTGIGLFSSSGLKKFRSGGGIRDFNRRGGF